MHWSESTLICEKEVYVCVFVHLSFSDTLSMSSLTWSLGRVTLVFHCAIPSSRHSRSSSQQLSCRRLSCNCALPRLSTSATPKTLQSTIESLHSGPELQSKIIVSSSGPEHSSVQPDQKPPPFHDYHRSVLQSVLSLVVALTMTIGIQGAPSSRDTFEDVPQTLSGKRTSPSHLLWI